MEIKNLHPSSKLTYVHYSSSFAYSIIDNDSVLAHNSRYWIFMKSCPLWQLFVISRSSISVNNKKYHRSYFFIRFDLYGDKHFFPVAFQILMFLRRNKWVLMANTYIEILDFYWEMGWTVFECKSYYSIFYIFYIKRAIKHKLKFFFGKI